MGREKIKSLYNAVSADYDVGTEDEFAAKLQDPQKRKALYDAVGQEYDLGDYETFSAKVVEPKDGGSVNLKQLAAPPVSAESKVKTGVETPRKEKEYSVEEFMVSPTEAKEFESATIEKEKPVMSDEEIERVRKFYSQPSDLLAASPRLQHAANSFLNAIGQGIASAPKSIGILAKKLDFGGEYEGKEAKDLATYKAGEYISKLSEDLFPTSPEFQDEFVTTILPQGAGSMVSLLASGYVSPTAPIMLGATSMGAPEYEAALTATGDPEKAFDAWKYNMLIGTTEAILPLHALSKIDKSTGGGIKKLLAAGFTGSMIEGAQGAGSQMATNFTAQQIYDSTRQIMDGTAESFAADALLGGFTNGAIEALNTRIESDIPLGEKIQLKAARNILQEEQSKIDKGEIPTKNEEITNLEKDLVKDIPQEAKGLIAQEIKNKKQSEEAKKDSDFEQKIVEEQTKIVESEIQSLEQTKEKVSESAKPTIEEGIKKLRDILQKPSAEGGTKKRKTAKSKAATADITTKTEENAEAKRSSSPEANQGREEVAEKGGEQPPTTIQSAVIEIGGKTYEGKNHAEAILKAKEDGQDISQVNRQAEGKFKLSDGTIIDRTEAKKRFGQDRSELLIEQDESADQANEDYRKITKPQTNDKENITGLPSEKRIGEEPVQAEPDEGAGGKEIGAGGNVQAQEEVAKTGTQEFQDTMDEIYSEISKSESSKETNKDKQARFKAELLKRGLPEQGAEGSSKLLVKALTDKNTAYGVLDVANKNLRDLWSKETGVELPKNQKGTRAVIDSYFTNADETKNIIDAGKGALKLFDNDVVKLANADPNYIYENVPEATPEVAQQIVEAAREKVIKGGGEHLLTKKEVTPVSEEVEETEAVEETDLKGKKKLPAMKPIDATWKRLTEISNAIRKNYSDKIDPLNIEASKLRKEISGKQSVIDIKKKEIRNLENSIFNAKHTQIEEINNKIAKAKSWVSKHEADIKPQTDRLAEIQSKINGFKQEQIDKYGEESKKLGNPINTVDEGMGILNLSDFEYDRPDFIKRAIKNNRYQEWINEGRITAQDAKEIIESAGLEVPKDIAEKAGKQKEKKPEKIDWDEKIKKAALSGEDIDDAYDQVAMQLPNVPAEVSKAWRDKYDPERKLTAKQAFKKYYDEITEVVKEEKPKESPTNQGNEEEYKPISGNEKTINEYLGNRSSAVVATMKDKETGRTLTLSLRPDTSSSGRFSIVISDGESTESRRMQYKGGDKVSDILGHFEWYINTDNNGRFIVEPKEVVAKKVIEDTSTPEIKDAKKRLKELQSIKYKSANQEKEIEILKKRLEANPDKWKIGDGVGYRVSGNQINRGFSIVDIDQDNKKVLIRQVADTGITSTGGNFDKIKTQWLSMGDLVRDRNYDLKEEAIQRILKSKELKSESTKEIQPNKEVKTEEQKSEKVTFTFLGEKLTGTREGNKIKGNDGKTYTIGDKMGQASDVKLTIDQELANAKQRLKDASDAFKNLGAVYDPEVEARKQLEFHKALVDVARLYIKKTGQKVKMALEDFAFEVGLRLKDVKAAWEEANGGKSNPPKYDFEYINKNLGKNKGATFNAFKKVVKAAQLDYRSGVKDQKQAQKELAQKVTDAVNAMLKEGTIPAKRAATLISKAANIKDVDKFLDYAQKVFDDANYAQLLSDAQENKKRLKAKAKSDKTLANNKDILAALSRIPVENLDDIAEYNQVTEDYLRSFLPVTSPNYKLFDNTIAQEYVEKVQKELDKKYVKSIEEKYGLIGLTKQEAKEIDAFFEAESAKYLENLEESKQKELKDRLRAIASYSQMAAQDISFDSSRSQGWLETIQKADLSTLDAATLKEYIKTVDNVVVNGSNANLGNLAAQIQAQQNIEEAAKIGGNKLDINRFEEAYYSLPLLLKSALGTSEAVADVRRLSGLEDIYTGGSRTNLEVEKQIKEYNKFKKENKISDKSTDNILRAMYAELIQHYGVDIDETFQANKKKIEQTIELYKEVKSMRKIGEEAERIYNEFFKDAKSVEDVDAAMDAKSPKNKSAVQWWIKEFEKTKQSLSENTEGIHNEKFEDVYNYTPLTRKLMNKSQENEEDGSFQRLDVPGKPKQSPTTISRSKSKSLPSGWAASLDFDFNMKNKFQKSRYDVNTSEARMLFRSFMRSPMAVKIFGGQDNVNAILSAHNQSEKMQRGVAQENSASGQIINTLTNTARSMAISTALGGVTQFLKQYPSVGVGTLFRLGKDADLLFKAYRFSKDNPIFSKFTIGERALREGGYDRGEILHKKIHSSLGESKLRKALEGVEDFSTSFKNLLFASLRTGDVAIAKRSWIAYYLQSLRKQGVDIDRINPETEVDKLNEPERKKAAAYAEQVVKETQIPSNPSEIAEIQKADGAYKRTFKDILFPFSTFTSNARARMINDMVRMKKGTTEERTDAAKDLSATIAEVITFQTINIALISSVLYPAGKAALFALFGIDDDDEDAEKEFDFKFKKFYSNALRDIFASGFGSIVENKFIDALNLSAYAIQIAAGSPDVKKNGEIIPYKEYLKDAPFYRYQKDGSDLGLYQILIDKPEEIRESFNLAFEEDKYIKTRFGDKKVKINEKEEDYMKFVMLMDMLASTGMTDADIYRIAKQGQKDILRKEKKEKPTKKTESRFK